MTFDLSEYETHLVVGIDEAGRGPLAGPVVAAGVVLDRHHPIAGLNDSKKLSEKAREELFCEINQHALAVAISEVDARNIDRINILRATLLAMKNVLMEISQKMQLDWALIDGNILIPGVVPVKQRAIVKGDSLVPSIMAASIVAKVHRDRLMKEFDKLYPGYGFESHKGYGTAMHMNALATLGPCPIHRLSYEPLRSPSLL
jgi:ribonuclease HII